MAASIVSGLYRGWQVALINELGLVHGYLRALLRAASRSEFYPYHQRAS